MIEITFVVMLCSHFNIQIYSRLNYNTYLFKGLFNKLRIKNICEFFVTYCLLILNSRKWSNPVYLVFFFVQCYCYVNVIVICDQANLGHYIERVFISILDFKRGDQGIP